MYDTFITTFIYTLSTMNIQINVLGSVQNILGRDADILFPPFYFAKTEIPFVCYNTKPPIFINV